MPIARQTAAFIHRCRRLRCTVIAGLLISWTAPVAAMQVPTTPPPQDEWRLVNEGLGRGGTTQPDGVRRYSFPRSDLKVRLDGVEIKPSLALGSWLAFQPMGDHVMVMGDLVLTHDEVNPVMSELLQGGLTVTALHNHLLRSSPATMYMHVRGHGDPWKLAVTLRTALAKSKTPLDPPKAVTQIAKLDLNTQEIERRIGASGKQAGDVYQFVIPRPERLTDAGAAAPETMGTGTVLNFQPLGNGRAAITGDFVLIASEVDPVLKALRGANIEVTALHNHMLDDQPRLFFMHFWAQGEAQALASGLRSALQQVARKS